MTVRRAGATLALLCASLAPASCAVDESAEVAAYRSVLDAGLESQPVESRPETREFAAAPLSVQDALLLANARNESLSIEGETYLQSLIACRRAVAAFLPTISLAPSYAFREGSGGDDTNAFDTPVDLSLEVNPVSDAAALAVAEALAHRRLALLLNFQDTLLLDVARVYFEAARAEQAVEVLLNSLEVQNERVSDARARLDAGLVRPLDVSLTESQAAQTAVDLTSARNLARTSRQLLTFLIASDASVRPLEDGLRAPDVAPTLAEFLARAELHRQDLAAAIRFILAAEKGVEAAYGQYYPTISVDVQAFLQRDTEPSDVAIAGILRLSLPLFSAGLIEADVRDTLSILRQAKHDETLTRRLVRRDVETAYSNLFAAIERLEQLERQVQYASDALAQAEGLYQVGLATNLERLAAQDRLLSTQLQLVNADLDRKVFYLDLLRTAGGLHELIGLVREPPIDPAPPGDSDEGGADAATR